MRVIGRHSPRTALGAIGLDLRASYPPENSASAEIARLLQRLCAIPANAVTSESHADAKRPQAFLSLR
jgi:hypothetical protein